MKPPAQLAAGFAVVFFAVRVNGFDLLLDPVGWMICTSALANMEVFDRAFTCGVAMILSSVLLLIAPSDWEQVIGLAAGVGNAVTVALMVEPVMAATRRHRNLLDVLRWAVAGPGVLVVLSWYGYAELGGLFQMVALVAMVTLIVVLVRVSQEPWEPPAGTPPVVPAPPTAR